MADFSILKKGKQYYGCLDFDKSMIRYADKRYLNVELILEDQSGLKIPKSSVIKNHVMRYLRIILQPEATAQTPE